MSEPEDGDAPTRPAPEAGEAPAPTAAPPRRFYMTKPEEVADAQERYGDVTASAGAAAKPSTPSPPARAVPPAVGERSAPAAPSPPARAASPVVPDVEPRALQLARLGAAGAALALAIAFFYPAVHDAVDREHRVAPLGGDGRALARPPPPRMYLLVNATPRGATVTLDGEEAGTTPMATNVECVDGAPIRLEIAAPGHATHVATVPCTPGGDVDISPALKRDARKR